MSLGRAAVELDAELGELAAKLQEALNLTERAVTDASGNRIEIDADTSAAEATIAELAGTVEGISGLDPSVNVSADTTEAEANIAGVQQTISDLDAVIVTAEVNADAAPAIAELQAVRDRLAELTGQPTTVTVDADTSAAEQRLMSVGDLLQGLPIRAIGGVAAMTAAAKFVADAYQQVDDSLDTIRQKTGLTGEALQQIERDFQAIARVAPNAIGETAAVIGTLQTATGLYGQRLQDLTRATLDFARVNETQAIPSAERLGQMYNALNLDGAEYVLMLDKITAASQLTGIPVERLIEQQTRLGPAFSDANFSIDEQIALFSVYEKNGGDAERLISSINMAMGRAAREGITDFGTHFRETIDAIADAPTQMDAVRIASELLGARVGPQFAADVRAGKLEYQPYVDLIADSQGTLNQTARDTEGVAEQIAQLRNYATLTAGTFANELIPPLAETLRLLIALSQVELPDWLGGNVGGLAGSAVFDSPILNPAGILGDAAGAVAGWIERTDEAAASQAGWNDLLGDGYTQLARFAGIVREAAAAASEELGVTVTLEDIKRGYVVTTDGQTRSLERFVQAAIRSSQATAEIGVNLNEMLGLLARQEGGGIGSLGAVLTGVENGMISIAEAAQLMASSTGGNFEAIRSAAQGMRQELESQRLAAIFNDDAESATALAIRIEVLDGVLGALDGTVLMLPPAFDEMTDGVYNAASAFTTAAGASDEAKTAVSDWLSVQNLVDTNVNKSAEAIGYWERNLSETERAMRSLEEAGERQGGMTEEQQRQYDLLTWGAERLQGGIHDLEGQYVEAAVAQVEFMRIQDELNAAVDAGDINQDQYNEAIAEARTKMLEAMGPSGELANSQQILADTVGGVVDKLRDLLIELGLIDGASARAEVNVVFRATGDRGAMAVIEGGQFGDREVGITEFAAGGYVHEPTLALLGEAGSELVLPLEDPRRMQELLSRLGGMGMTDSPLSSPLAGSFGAMTTSMSVNVGDIHVSGVADPVMAADLVETRIRQFSNDLLAGPRAAGANLPGQV